MTATITLPTPSAPDGDAGSSQAPHGNMHETVVRVAFIEGPRSMTKAELRDNDITKHLVTPYYDRLIRESPYYEQLRLIVEPSLQEFTSPGMLDTSGEGDNTVVPGLQHKYPQTGLLLVTDRCTSYCRYCFRKRIVGNDSDEVAPDFAVVAEYIAAHPEMTNVLMSGGDPFVLNTPRLESIIEHLLPIPHLNSIRFGSKTTAFNPSRFLDPALPAMFERIRTAGKTPIVVTHFDHVGEISSEAEAACAHLIDCGVTLLNQTVLLHGVNDDPDILAATIARLHAIRVRPYYVFQGRPVKGASHFQVPLRDGIEVVRQTNARLSGIQKTFRYIMSHYTGKIEILGIDDDDRVYLRYHQSPIADRIGRVFMADYVDGACWLDDMKVREWPC